MIRHILMALQAAFLIEVTGDAAFDATCVVDGETVTFQGTPPMTKRLEGENLTCDFRQTEDGSVTVIVTTPRGNRSASSMSGSGGSLRMSLQ